MQIFSRISPGNYDAVATHSSVSASANVLLTKTELGVLLQRNEKNKEVRSASLKITDNT